SQPDRFMSCFPVLPPLIDEIRQGGDGDRLAARRLGATVADLVILREMSLSVLGQLAEGHAPAREAALVKDLGNSHEQQIPNLVRELSDCPATLARGNRPSQLQSSLTQNVRSYAHSGGTREGVEGISAKGLGLG